MARPKKRAVKKQELQLELVDPALHPSSQPHTDLWDGKEEKVDELVGHLSHVPKRRKLADPPYAANTHVPLVPPGGSYNPAPEEHQKLVEAAETEEEQLFLKNQQEAEEFKAIQRVQGDVDDEVQKDDGNEEEEEQEEKEEKVHVNVAHTKKKTKAQRNTIRKRRLQEAAKKQQQIQLGQLRDLERVQDIVRVINREENGYKRKRMEKEEAKKAMDPIPRGWKDLPKHLSVVLPEDLPGNMRCFQAPSNPLLESVKLFQKRGLVSVPKKKSSGKHTRAKPKYKMHRVHED